jgi:hypothetical protein
MRLIVPGIAVRVVHDLKSAHQDAVSEPGEAIV